MTQLRDILFWKGNFRILQKQIRSPKLHKNLSFKETIIRDIYNSSSFFIIKKCLKLLNKRKHCTTFLNIWSTIFFSRTLKIGSYKKVQLWFSFKIHMSTPFTKKTPASNADCFARCYHKGGKYYCYNFLE